MKILVPLSSYPIFNIRYTKLLSELSKKAEIYVIAGSKLKNPSYIISNNLKVIYSLPFTLPRRIRYVIGPHLSQIIAQDSAKFLKYDFIWLIDSITFYTALRGRGPFIIDTDDPTFRYLSLRERIKSSIESKFIRSKKVVRIITTSNLLKEKFVKFLKIEESKIVVIPNGVDLNIFRETPIPSEPIVLYYGTLAPHRAKLLMSVIEEVLKKKPESKFIIIGDVPDSLKKYIQSKELNNKIELTGFVPHDKLPFWISKARVCIFTQDVSLGGRLSIKLLEYMASGRPIVATDVEEAWPVIEANSGIIVPRDPVKFADATIMLLEDDSLAEKLAKKGLDYVKKFDWQHILNKYIEVFEEILSSK